VLAVALAPAALLVAQTEPAKGVGIGERAPELRCKSATGKDLGWRDFADRAVIVYFHAQDMAYSRRGLEALGAELAAAEDLKARAALLVVTSGDRDLGWLQEQLDKSGLPGAITVDADRESFQRYQAVAFPTVYCITPDRTVAHVAKGFGPLLSSKVAAGARLAAGLLDEQGFRDALQKHEVAEGTDELLRVARSVRMAEQLFRSGMLAEARGTLEKVLRPDSRSAEGLVLLTRIVLAQGQRLEAAPHLERLAALAPQAPELRELRAELALLGGDAEGALKELEGVDDRQLRIAWIKGRALEHLQRFREAAAVYKKALAAALEQDR
jgi:tetratricopeptide (TPR) repeat protein